MHYILLSEKSWHQELFVNLQKQIPTAIWTWIRYRDEFTYAHLNSLNPNFVFIPHWSYIIPAEIYEKFVCVVFHMTDLPYGRGGSPLQNLIARGHDQTMMSAIQVSKGIDTGPVFLKKPLNLQGSAEEIFIRAAEVINKMIVEIIHSKIQPLPQSGLPVIFERRKPEDGNIASCRSIEQVYDIIRMLDCEGYPNAFLETDKLRLEFTRATLKSGKSIIADVRISKK